MPMNSNLHKCEWDIVLVIETDSSFCKIPLKNYFVNVRNPRTIFANFANGITLKIVKRGHAQKMDLDILAENNNLLYGKLMNLSTCKDMAFLICQLILKKKNSRTKVHVHGYMTVNPRLPTLCVEFIFIY